MTEDPFDLDQPWSLGLDSTEDKVFRTSAQDFSPDFGAGTFAWHLHLHFHVITQS